MLPVTPPGLAAPTTGPAPGTGWSASAATSGLEMPIKEHRGRGRERKRRLVPTAIGPRGVVQVPGRRIGSSRPVRGPAPGPAARCLCGTEAAPPTAATTAKTVTTNLTTTART